jgi:hypothetical protein
MEILPGVFFPMDNSCVSCAGLLAKSRPMEGSTYARLLLSYEAASGEVGGAYSVGSNLSDLFVHLCAYSANYPSARSYLVA